MLTPRARNSGVVSMVVPNTACQAMNWSVRSQCVTVVGMLGRKPMIWFAKLKTSIPTMEAPLLRVTVDSMKPQALTASNGAA